MAARLTDVPLLEVKIPTPIISTAAKLSLDPVFLPAPRHPLTIRCSARRELRGTGARGYRFPRACLLPQEKMP